MNHAPFPQAEAAAEKAIREAKLAARVAGEEQKLEAARLKEESRRLKSSGGAGADGDEGDEGDGLTNVERWLETAETVEEIQARGNFQKSQTSSTFKHSIFLKCYSHTFGAIS